MMKCSQWDCGDGGITINLLDAPSITNTQKKCPFHHRGLECKSRKSRDTWSNRQIWPWSTK